MLILVLPLLCEDPLQTMLHQPSDEHKQCTNDLTFLVKIDLHLYLFYIFISFVDDIKENYG